MKKSHKKTVIGVIGSWNASETEHKNAEALGAGIAKHGWVTLTGGEPGGVMQSASKGAKEADGFVVGILPGSEKDPYSGYIDVPIFTNASHGRDYYNVLSSDIVIVSSRLSSGTFIEALFALKCDKQLIVLNDSPEEYTLLKERGGDLVHSAATPEDALALCEQLLSYGT